MCHKSMVPGVVNLKSAEVQLFAIVLAITVYAVHHVLLVAAFPRDALFLCDDQDLTYFLVTNPNPSDCVTC